jgi:hypothetical protein
MDRLAAFELIYRTEKRFEFRCAHLMCKFHSGAGRATKNSDNHVLFAPAPTGLSVCSHDHRIDAVLKKIAQNNILMN